jgi:hypothetical protein
MGYNIARKRRNRQIGKKFTLAEAQSTLRKQEVILFCCRSGFSRE